MAISWVGLLVIGFVLWVLWGMLRHGRYLTFIFSVMLLGFFVMLFLPVVAARRWDQRPATLARESPKGIPFRTGFPFDQSPRPATTIEVKFRPSANERYEPTTEDVYAAVHQLLRKLSDADSPRDIPLSTLESIPLMKVGDEQIALRNCARLYRSTRGLRRSSDPDLIQLELEGDDLAWDEIAHELQLEDQSHSDGVRALRLIEIEDDRLTLLVHRGHFQQHLPAEPITVASASTPETPLTPETPETPATPATPEAAPVAEAPESPAEVHQAETQVAVATNSSAAELATPVAEAPPTNATNSVPDWVKAAPVPQDGTYFVTGSDGPYTTREECQTKLVELVGRLAQQYLDAYLGEREKGSVTLTGAEIGKLDLLKESYFAPVEVSLGTMYQVHALLAFDHDDRRYIERKLNLSKIHQRLAIVGGMSTSVLLLIGGVFGYLKLDTATRGYYSGRLVVALALGLAALLGAAILLMRLIASGPGTPL